MEKIVNSVSSRITRIYAQQVKDLKLNPVRFGIIVSIHYQSKTAIQQLFSRLKQEPQYIIIHSSGSKVGLDPYVKELALSLGFEYSEFNPCHTPYNNYSFFPPFRHNKKFSSKNFLYSYYNLIKNSDKLIIFASDKEEDKIIEAVIKKLRTGYFDISYAIIK